MRNFLLLFTISFFTPFCAQHTLKVTVNNIESTKGNIRIALYKDKNSFLKKPFKTAQGKIENKKTEVIFTGIPKGIYAVSLYQDENSNRKLDFGMFGIPKEPTASSNNAKGFMGPPKFEDAQFKIEKNTAIKISLN